MEPIQNDNHLDEIFQLIRTGHNVLLHGPGGVGKSYIIKQLYAILSDIPVTMEDAIEASTAYRPKTYVTATTGVAAVNLSDEHVKATTLHSFAGVGTAELDATSLLKKMKYIAVKRWEDCELLIIDEISMLGAKLFKKLDIIAKHIRKNNKPFGGIQLIVSGDFLQLPPVKDDWIFACLEFTQLKLHPVIFKEPFRYTDVKFFELLQRARIGKINKSDFQILNSRVKANQNMHALLKDIVEQNKASVGEVIRPTMLFSKRCDVYAFNMQELEKIKGDNYIFNALDTIMYTDNNIAHEAILDDAIPSQIILKVGAQVMLRINLSVDEGLVNGSRGVVNEIIPDEAVIVKFLNGQKIRIELNPYVYETISTKIIRLQIPLILAFANTIHKLQGCTCDYVIVDLGPSVFSPAQAYVALSRCRNIQGLFISEFIQSSIRSDKDALLYVEQLDK